MMGSGEGFGDLMADRALLTEGDGSKVSEISSKLTESESKTTYVGDSEDKALGVIKIVSLDKSSRGAVGEDSSTFVDVSLVTVLIEEGTSLLIVSLMNKDEDSKPSMVLALTDEKAKLCLDVGYGLIEFVAKGNRILPGLASIDNMISVTREVVRTENSDISEGTKGKSTDVPIGKKESDNISEGTKVISITSCESLLSRSEEIECYHSYLFIQLKLV